MSDTDTKPTLGRKPLGLKTSVQAGEVKQTFSHGRTNKVVVEVKRRKLIGKPGEAAPAPEPARSSTTAARARSQGRAQAKRRRRDAAGAGGPIAARGRGSTPDATGRAEPARTG